MLYARKFGVISQHEIYSPIAGWARIANTKNKKIQKYGSQNIYQFE